MSTTTTHKPDDLAAIVGPAPYVTQEVAAQITGYSVKAIIRKRQDGHWLEGREWVRAPDGKPLISIEGYRRWVERTGKKR
jgi:hypothetical protein